MNSEPVLIERKSGDAWKLVERLAGITGVLTELVDKELERARLYFAGATHVIVVPAVAGGVPIGLRATVAGKTYLVGGSIQVGADWDVFVAATG